MSCYLFVARSDDQRPKRLSNTRVRPATPSLQLKPSKPSAAPRRGPFIHEDEDVAPPASLSDQPVRPSTPRAASPNSPGPLREISPNASPQKSERGSQIAQTDGNQDDVAPLKEASKPLSNPAAQLHDAEASFSNPPQDQAQLAADLASILARQVARSASTPPTTEALKRKHRPLGRNLSGLSARSISGAGDTATLRVEESDLAADGSMPVPETVQPPSTQLSYEMPEAEAQRALMGRRLGVKDEGGVVARRIESLGTVKDRDAARRPVAGGGRRRR